MILAGIGNQAVGAGGDMGGRPVDPLGKAQQSIEKMAADSTLAVIAFPAEENAAPTNLCIADFTHLTPASLPNDFPRNIRPCEVDRRPSVQDQNPGWPAAPVI